MTMYSTMPLAFVIRDEEDEITDVGLCPMDNLEDITNALMKPDRSIAVVVASTLIH